MVINADNFFTGEYSAKQILRTASMNLNLSPTRHQLGNSRKAPIRKDTNKEQYLSPRHACFQTFPILCGFLSNNIMGDTWEMDKFLLTQHSTHPFGSVAHRTLTPPFSGSQIHQRQMYIALHFSNRIFTSTVLYAFWGILSPFLKSMLHVNINH